MESQRLNHWGALLTESNQPVFHPSIVQRESNKRCGNSVLPYITRKESSHWMFISKGWCTICQFNSSDTQRPNITTTVVTVIKLLITRYHLQEADSPKSTSLTPALLVRRMFAPLISRCITFFS